jgi:hypothetical protein
VVGEEQAASPRPALRSGAIRRRVSSGVSSAISHGSKKLQDPDEHAARRTACDSSALRIALVGLLAISGRAAAGTPSTKVTGAPFPNAEERLAIFHQLVEVTRKYHVFAPATERNLGRR